MSTLAIWSSELLALLLSEALPESKRMSLPIVAVICPAPTVALTFEMGRPKMVRFLRDKFGMPINDWALDRVKQAWDYQQDKSRDKRIMGQVKQQRQSAAIGRAWLHTCRSAARKGSDASARAPPSQAVRWRGTAGGAGRHGAK